MITPNRSLKQRAYEETKKFIIIAFYLWLIFSLMLLYKSLILEPGKLPITQTFQALRGITTG